MKTCRLKIPEKRILRAGLERHLPYSEDLDICMHAHELDQLAYTHIFEVTRFAHFVIMERLKYDLQLILSAITFSNLHYWMPW